MELLMQRTEMCVPCIEVYIAQTPCDLVVAPTNSSGVWAMGFLMQRIALCVPCVKDYIAQTPDELDVAPANSSGVWAM